MYGLICPFQSGVEPRNQLVAVGRPVDVSEALRRDVGACRSASGRSEFQQVRLSALECSWIFVYGVNLDLDETNYDITDRDLRSIQIPGH
jgi:hypothetical protein